MRLLQPGCGDSRDAWLWLGTRECPWQMPRSRDAHVGEKGLVAMGTHRLDALKNVPSHSKAPHFNDLICLFALILIWQLMKMKSGNIL